MKISTADNVAINLETAFERLLLPDQKVIDSVKQVNVDEKQFKLSYLNRFSETTTISNLVNSPENNSTITINVENNVIIGFSDSFDESVFFRNENHVSPDSGITNFRSSHVANLYIAKFQEILQDSATGRRALETFTRYGVTMIVKSGDGSFFDFSTNSVTIDSTHSPLRMAFIFVHEMTHVRASHEGRSGNPQTQSRDDYIRTMLNEEVDSFEQENLARIELEAAGHDVSEAIEKHSIIYNSGYQMAVTNAQRADSRLTPQELDYIGRQAGRARLHKSFLEGNTGPTSTDKELTHPEHYARGWDSYHLYLRRKRN